VNGRPAERGAPLPKGEHARLVLPNEEHESSEHLTPSEADALSAQLFDAALMAAKLSNKEVAYLLGISPSLVRKMRSADDRARPSLPQLLRLPARFHRAFHREMNKRFGYAHHAAVRMLAALGDLASLEGAL